MLELLRPRRLREVSNGAEKGILSYLGGLFCRAQQSAPHLVSEFSCRLGLDLT
jgi:hypothetical protein